MNYLFKNHLRKHNSYALVLGGGGANGSYEIGVWKALIKLNINISAVFGTSVGALNATMIIQNEYKKAVKLWETLSIEKVVKIPSDLLKEGKLNLSHNTITSLNELGKSFFENRGLDTTPLRNLILGYIDEKKIRKSKIDFGIVTYEVNGFKPREVLLEEIPQGLIVDYLLASASLPVIFKNTVIDGKRFMDGGIYDNVPFSLAKKRGYKNIIIVDLSSLGRNRRPNTVGTKSVYIKNSTNLGNMLDFSPKKSKRILNIGYLDTLNAFGYTAGINYFIKLDLKTIEILEKILLDKNVFKEYSKYLISKNLEYSPGNIILYIKEILPRNMKYYYDFLISLIECAALSLNIENYKFYDLRELLELIWEKYTLLESKYDNESECNNIFDYFSEKIKKIKSQNDIKEYFDRNPYEFERTLEIIFGKDKLLTHKKTISNFFPNLLCANVFFVVLKKYIKRNKIDLRLR